MASVITGTQIDTMDTTPISVVGISDFQVDLSKTTTNKKVATTAWPLFFFLKQKLWI